MAQTTRLLREPPDLERTLARLLRQIPAGRVATCGALATALGDRAACRWVGRFLRAHRHTADCPCHRVVRADGTLGQFVAGSVHTKRSLLAAEGVEVAGGAVDLDRYGFDALRCAQPLVRLAWLQERLAAQIRFCPPRSLPRLVGGIDVAYPHERLAVGAMVVIDTSRGRAIWSAVLCRPVRFPYITGYLAFRELPALLALVAAAAQAGRLPEVLLVDGSGTLHPRGAGIAAHLGVATNVPTVGLTKTLLCGEVDWQDMAPGESRPVFWQGQIAGMALRPTAGSRRPIFLSPGHRADVAFAERVVRQMLKGRRLPEPLHWADRLSRQPGTRLP